jgi:hypothetical protein
MKSWLVLQSFYNGLTLTSRPHIDAAAGGAFLDLMFTKATILIEKMVSNQGWSEDRLQPWMKGMHTVKETDMLAAKLNLLLKKMDEGSKQHIRAPVQALDSHFTCEVCENGGHSGDDYPETHEDCAYLNKNNGFQPQGG